MSYVRLHFQIQDHEDLLLFSSESFIVTALTVQSLLHFECIFCMWSEVEVQLHSSEYEYPVIPESCIEETVLSPLNSFGNLVENNYSYIHGFISELSSLFH